MNQLSLTCGQSLGSVWQVFSDVSSFTDCMVMFGLIHFICWTCSTRRRIPAVMHNMDLMEGQLVLDSFVDVRELSGKLVNRNIYLFMHLFKKYWESTGLRQALGRQRWTIVYYLSSQRFYFKGKNNKNQVNKHIIKYRQIRERGG